MNKTLFFLAFLCLKLYQSKGQVVDIDGNIYKTERIGVHNIR